MNSNFRLCSRALPSSLRPWPVPRRLLLLLIFSAVIGPKMMTDSSNTLDRGEVKMAYLRANSIRAWALGRGPMKQQRLAHKMGFFMGRLLAILMWCV